MDLGGERKSTAGDWITLSILTLVFVVGELSHFLLGIVTRPQSQELEYGPRGCLNNPDFLHPVSCYEAHNETRYESIKFNDESIQKTWLYIVLF